MSSLETRVAMPPGHPPGTSEVHDLEKRLKEPLQIIEKKRCGRKNGGSFFSFPDLQG